MNVLFLGDSGVGKTTLIHYLLSHGKSKKNHQITLGIEYHTFKKCTLIDTGEYYASKVSIESLNNITHIVIVYDIYSKESLEYAMNIYNKFKDKYPIILLANKIDKYPGWNLDLFTNEHSIKISASSGENVFETFKMIINNDHSFFSWKDNCCFF